MDIGSGKLAVKPAVLVLGEDLDDITLMERDLVLLCRIVVENGPS
jgi:hypothetical protein